MFAHGVGHIDPFQKKASTASGDGDGKGGSSKGDGLHHHEMHEDEGGGFHSKHTAPDGKVTHMDHGSYSDARDHMDDMHGEEHKEEPDADESGRNASDDFDKDDMAGSYGAAADCE